MTAGNGETKMKTIKNERQNARGAELAYVKGKAAASPEASAWLRPNAHDLDYVRECTERNHHTEASRYVADWLAVRWDDEHGGDGFTKPGNPFRIIAEAFARIEYEHRVLGHMPFALIQLRQSLLLSMENIVSDEPFAAAWGDFMKVL